MTALPAEAFGQVPGSCGSEGLLRRASDRDGGELFGETTALSGDLIAVGAQWDEDRFLGAGAAYVYRFDPVRSEWNEEAKLTPADLAEWDFFGGSVAVGGGRVLVGADGDDDLGDNSGSVYVFRFDPTSSSWVEEAKMTAPDAQPVQRFGRSLALLDGRLLVGAPTDPEAADDAGAAYLLRAGGRIRELGVDREAARLGRGGGRRLRGRRRLERGIRALRCLGG